MDMFYIIAEQSLLHLPLLIGAYISLSLMKVPDLSIESAFIGGAFMGSLTAQLCSSLAFPFKVALLLLASALGGGLVGMTSSLITQLGRFPHLLSSIITFGIFYSFNQLIGGTYISLHTVNNPLAIGLIPQHPELIMLVILGLLVGLPIQLLLKRQLGYSFAFYGNNPGFFSHYGVSERFVFMIGIIVANALAGVSGYLTAQSNGFADISMGFGKVLLCVTALVLGKGIFTAQREPSLKIPLIGVAVYFSLQQLLLRSGLSIKYFSLLQSLVVLAVLLLIFRKQRKAIHNVGV